MSNTIDQQFVEYIVKALVGNPDKVEIERTIDEKGVLLSLKVDPEDLGRVIGKRGNTAQSIRTLLRALGTKNDARYNLKIVDTAGGDRPERPERRDEAPVAPVETDVEEKAAPVVEETAVTAAGSSQWAHLSSTPTDEDDTTTTDDTTDEPESEEDSVVEKTKKELEGLDDLDI